MKRYLLIFIMLLGAVRLIAQTPTVASLVATGSAIKWYAVPTGGVALDPSTPLVNGAEYWASQTVNGCESSARFEVTATLNTVSAPAAATLTPSQTQIVWNWNAVTGATGYKWNTSNTYSSATDMGNVLTQAETPLICNTSYTRYVWAYNGSGCVSGATILTQTTLSCVTTWIGGLNGFSGNIGSTYDFLVTGTTAGSIWGCNVYTDDSNLATAAVHAGYVGNGVTRNIRVLLLAGQSNYSSCSGNGITSNAWGSWPRSYEIIGSW
jgi:hypothetical protein